MADQPIQPLPRTPRSGDALKQRRVPVKRVPAAPHEQARQQKKRKKGIIDTYA